MLFFGLTIFSDQAKTKKKKIKQKENEFRLTFLTTQLVDMLTMSMDVCFHLEGHGRDGGAACCGKNPEIGRENEDIHFSSTFCLSASQAVFFESLRHL